LPLALAPPDVSLCGPHAGGSILRGALDSLAVVGCSVLLGWSSLYPASKFFSSFLVDLRSFSLFFSSVALQETTYGPVLSQVAI
jgi:hypothetical protein